MRLQYHIRPKTTLVLTLLVLVFLIVILGSSKTALGNYRVLVIKPSQDTFLVGPYLEIFEDPTGELSFEQITSPKYVDNFTPIGSSSINLAITSTTYWLRFQCVMSVGNDVDGHFKKHHWIFDPDFVLPARVNWTLFEKEKKQAVFKHLSNSRSYYQIPCATNIFRTYYLKMDSSTLITFKPQITKASTFITKSKNISIFQGTYFGIILAVAFYLMATFRSLKESSHFWYVLHIITLACFFFFFKGLSADYLPLDYQDGTGVITRGILTLALTFAGCFARSTIKQRDESKKTFFCYSFLIFSFLTTFILNFFLSGIIINITLIFLGIIGAFIAIFATAISWQNKKRISLTFLLAWFFFLMGGLAFALSFSGILPYHYLLINAFQIGSAVSAILFAMALKTHISALQKAKLFSEKNEGRVKSILDSIQSGVLIVDYKTSKIIEANLQAVMTINAPKNEIINTNWRRYIWPSDELINKSASSSIDIKTKEEHFLSTYEGKEIPIICDAKPITLNNQKILLLSFIDITNQRQAEHEKKKLIKELRKALADIKKLSGLLPICANCKKIRDDKGYWNQIEEYLTEHSDVDFSHSICPDCAKKLYPELGDIYNDKNEK